MFVEEVVQAKQTIEMRNKIAYRKQHHIDYYDVERNALRIYIVEHGANLMQEMKRMSAKIICSQIFCRVHHLQSL